MNQQHVSNAGAFDPNKAEYQNVSHHIIYDQSQQQQRHPQQQQQQQNYAMQGYEIVDSSPYMMQNQHQQPGQPQQNVIQYNTADYSNSQQQHVLPTYYDHNPSLAQHHLIFEQSPAPQSNAQINLGHQQQFYDSGGASGQSYVYFGGQNEVHQQQQQQQPNQYGQLDSQREYLHQNMIGHHLDQGQIQTMQLRPQPMTAEQLQLSQQRLLGIATAPRVQVQQIQQVQQIDQGRQMQQSEQGRQMQHAQQIEQDQQIQQIEQNRQIRQAQQIEHSRQIQQLQQIQQGQQMQQLQHGHGQQHMQQLQQLQQNQPTQPMHQGQQQQSQQHQQMVSPHQQIMQQQQQQQGIGGGNYGPMGYNLPSTAAHGSPAGSSYTSSGTDISDEGDDMFGAPSPYKRSPTGAGDQGANNKRKGKKRKMQKDPNEPQKPVSAYALFFRDTQAAIKGQTPSATFGDVSKIVASMWDNLDADGKNVYKQRTELAKKDYLKQLAAYRANLLSKGNRTNVSMMSGPPVVQFFEPFPQQPQQQQQLPQRKLSAPGQWPSQSETTATTTNSIDIGGKSLASLISESKPQQMLTTTTTSVIVQQSSAPIRTVKQEYSMKPEPYTALKPEGICIRPDCQKPAIECPQWDGEYCTDECVSKHCRDIFTAWVQSKQTQQPHESAGAIAPS